MADITTGDVTVTVNDRFRQGKKHHTIVDIDFGDGALTYPTGGVPLPAFGNFALRSFLDYLNILDADNSNGLVWKYDKTNTKLRAYRVNEYIPIFTGGSAASATIDLIHDASAAANGVAIYAHETTPLSNKRAVGVLEFVSPTNVDGSGTINNGGTTYEITDSDFAATGGLQIYFDEDAGTASERFLIDNPTKNDVLVTLVNGSILNLKHDTNAATSGVPVFFDEDAVNTYERLLFVSPTTTNGSGETDANIELGKGTVTGTINQLDAAELVELPNTFAPAAQTIKAEAVGW